MSLKISISGPAGSGKSSIIKGIVEQYWYQTADVGQVFRARAVTKGLTIAEYDKFIEKNPQEDEKMEKDFRNIVLSSDKNIIVSRRMGFYALPKMFTIRLDVSPEEGAKRIFNQHRDKDEKNYKTREETMEANTNRMNRLQKRLIDVYWVDFTDITNYDKIINTNGMSIQDTVDEVMKLIQQYEKSL